MNIIATPKKKATENPCKKPGHKNSLSAISHGKTEKICSEPELSLVQGTPSAGGASGICSTTGSSARGETKIRPLQMLEDVKTFPLMKLYEKYKPEYDSTRSRKQKVENSSGYVWQYNDFREVLLDVGLKSDPRQQLDRIDNDCKEYAPGLCRWLLPGSNNENKGNTQRLTDSNHVTHTAKEWERRKEGVTDVSADTMLKRVGSYNWCEHCAIHLPKYARCPHTSSPAPATSPPKKAVFGDAVKISQKAQALLSIFTTVMEKEHDSPHFVLEPKYSRLLDDIARGIEAAGLSSTEVFTCAVSNWRSFVIYAEKRDAFNLSVDPDIKDIRGNINIVCNYYHHRIEQAREDAESKLKQAKSQRERDERHRQIDVDNRKRAEMNRIQEAEDLETAKAMVAKAAAKGERICLKWQTRQLKVERDWAKRYGVTDGK